jgi:hypothetical protein
VTVFEETVSSTQTSKYLATVIDRESRSQKPAGAKRDETTIKERHGKAEKLELQDSW